MASWSIRTVFDGAKNSFLRKTKKNLILGPRTVFYVMQSLPCGSRVMSIFTKRARPAKMMLGEALSPFFIQVAGQC